MKQVVFISILFILIIPISLCGCATTFNPATGSKEAIFIGTESETAIGNSAASQVAKKYPLSSNPKDMERLNRIGQRVAQASHRQDLTYKFYLIEDKDLNAFTIPGGHVYIFKGLYEQLSNDELACVLAHEIGHIAARHIVKKMQAALGFQIISTIALATYQKGRQENEKQASCIAYAASTAFNLVALGYSRQDEFQADDLAVKYASKAGYNPAGMAGALRKLEASEKKGMPVPYILRSHPYIEERIKRIEE